MIIWKRENKFWVCTISPLSPPKSVFSFAQVHHLQYGASASNENAPDYKWRTLTSEKTKFGGERGEIVIHRITTTNNTNKQMNNRVPVINRYCFKQ